MKGCLSTKYKLCFAKFGVGVGVREGVGVG
jgi:hypothetical protein